MKPLRPRPPRESAIVDRIRARAQALGWLVEKTHGNSFQPGWPDLFLARSGPRGCEFRWVEVKRPTGRLTRAQRVRFALWEEHAVGVWVITSELELPLLNNPPNWREWS